MLYLFCFKHRSGKVSKELLAVLSYTIYLLQNSEASKISKQPNWRVVCFLKKSNGYKKLRVFDVLFAIVLVFILICPTILAQSSTDLASTDKFSFPDSNSVLSFSAEGSYEMASYENGAWTFVNILLNDPEQLEGLNLTVSAKESDLTIRTYQRFDITFHGIILSYVVNGEGEQSFDFGLTPEQGAWSILFNEELISEGDGWNISDDSKLTVTGATSNVTVLYVSYSNFGDDNSNKSFYEQHSVGIMATVLVTVTVIVTLIIKLMQRHVKKGN